MLVHYHRLKIHPKEFQDKPLPQRDLSGYLVFPNGYSLSVITDATDPNPILGNYYGRWEQPPEERRHEMLIDLGKRPNDFTYEEECAIVREQSERLMVEAGIDPEAKTVAWNVCFRDITADDINRLVPVIERQEPFSFDVYRTPAGRVRLMQDDAQYFDVDSTAPLGQNRNSDKLIALALTIAASRRGPKLG